MLVFLHADGTQKIYAIEFSQKCGVNNPPPLIPRLYVDNAQSSFFSFLDSVNLKVSDPTHEDITS